MGEAVLSWSQLGQIAAALGGAFAVIRGWHLVRRLLWGSL